MRSLTLGAVLALSGCSLIRTSMPPPIDTWTERSECRDSYAPPVVDALAGAVGAAGIGVGLVGAARGTDVGTGLGIAGVGVLIAGGFLTSAIIGVKRIDSCRTALSLWDAEHPGQRPGEVEEALARQELRCPIEPIDRRDLDFARGDARRDSHPWAEQSVSGCGRLAWCGHGEDGRPRCGATADFDLARRQLSVETGCPEGSILQEQAFGLATQVTYRLRGCGHVYSCIVPMVAVTDSSIMTGARQEHDRAAGSVFGSQLTCKPAENAPAQ